MIVCFSLTGCNEPQEIDTEKYPVRDTDRISSWEIQNRT